MRLARDVLIMPARDYLHNIVKNALIKDGWIITHDPFTIVFGTRRVYAVDATNEEVLEWRS